MFDKILDIIFPPVCGFCGEKNYGYLCKECESKIRKNSTSRKEKVKGKYFSEKISLFSYKGEIRNKILGYKFSGKSYMYKTFVKIILNDKKIYDILKSCDIITNVPIHKKRKNERGYDQSELIAKEIAQNIKNLKFAKILIKVRNIEKQSLLDKKERANNIKNAYEIINEEIICNKKIILFDDVYTSGATTNECARMLKRKRSKRS